MDGYQLVERIRRDPARARLPVIAVSALASPADRERTRRAGFDAHLGKPFDYASLRETFRFVMRRRRELLTTVNCDRLPGAFAEEVRRKARELQQTVQVRAGREHAALRGTSLPCRCSETARDALTECAVPCFPLRVASALRG